MKKVVSALLIAIGLLNFLPVVGVVSSAQLEALYGLRFERTDAILLMRHRAVLFGLIGSFVLFSAFRPRLQFLAGFAGLISMSSFVLLAYLSAGVSADLNKIVIADVVGSVAAVIVMILVFKDRRSLRL